MSARRAHERQRDEVRAHLDGELEVGEVLLGDRRQLRPRVGDVDALAGRQRPGRDGARDDGRRRALDGEARHAVADDDLGALRDERGERGEVDPTRSAGRAAGGAKATRRRPRTRARRSSRREPQLRALQVEQQADRPPGPLGGGAHLGRAAAQVLGVPCEQFSRAQSIPAATSWSSTPGGSVAGPSVATIFVRRSSIPPECGIEPLGDATCVGERWGVDEPIGR